MEGVEFNITPREEVHGDSDPMCNKIVTGEGEETCEKNLYEDCPCQNETELAEDEISDFSAGIASRKSTGSQIKKPHLAHEGKKPKLRTSKDVYDRLTWDSESITLQTSMNELEPLGKLDTSSIYIGYKDRFLGICELPLEEFNPAGDIPFHRVYYFRTGGPPILPFIGRDGEVKVREDNIPEGAVFIWDRDSRTDLIFKSGNSTLH